MRRELHRRLTHPLWEGAHDDEVAAGLEGVTSADVRAARDQIERDALSSEVMDCARLIAARTGSPEPLSAIIRRAMRDAAWRAHRAAEAAEKITEGDRSAGRTQSRPTRAHKRVGGVSGIGNRDGASRKAGAEGIGATRCETRDGARRGERVGPRRARA